MSEFKFDKMKNLDIPDEWAENTITSISKLDNSKEKHIPYSRYVISFASFVFVVVISVVVFMMTNNDLFSSQTKDETVSVNQTEISTKNQENVETSAPTQMQTELPTEESTVETDLTENDNEYTENDYPDEYEDPDESGSQSNNSSGDSNPAMKPNGSSDGSLNNIKYIVAPDLDTDKPPEEKYLYTSFLPYPYTGPAIGDEIFYCKIVNRGEKFILDDPDLYDESRKVGVYETDVDFITIRFCAGKNGGVTKNGDYDFYVYDADGVIQQIDRVRITWFN